MSSLEDKTSDFRAGLIPVPFNPKAYYRFAELTEEIMQSRIERGERIEISTTYYVNGMSRTYYDPRTGRTITEYSGKTHQRLQKIR